MPKKQKNYIVRIIAYTNVLVINAKDEEQAYEYANDRVSRGDFEIDEMSIDMELKTPRDIENARHHCNCVAEDE